MDEISPIALVFQRQMSDTKTANVDVEADRLALGA